jgi:hypothetical protein
MNRHSPLRAAEKWRNLPADDGAAGGLHEPSFSLFALPETAYFSCSDDMKPLFCDNLNCLLTGSLRHHFAL